MTNHNYHDMFLSPDEDGRWNLSHNYTLRFEKDTTTGDYIAVVRGKHGDIATIPADELDHLHKVFYSAACVHERGEHQTNDR